MTGAFFRAALLSLPHLVFSLDNGLATTPPMGWLSWERFRCVTDCDADPDNCVNEALYKRHADIMVQDGFVDAGYDQVNIDDCWSEIAREGGALVADRKLFPSGMKALADYMHARGIGLGIYNDVGTKTCSGYPGVCKDENCTSTFANQDAETYASWGIDSLKMDGCNSVHTPDILDPVYIDIGRSLNATGRPFLYSCSWPDYIRGEGYEVNYTLTGEHCNIWRMYDDIQDSWASVTQIADWVGDNQGVLQPATGPGRWNDLDSLIIGNFGLSTTQMRAQMAIWCVTASPLFMGNDLRKLSADAKSILLNQEVIAVNQQTTPAGLRMVHYTGWAPPYAYGPYDVWARNMTNGDVAVALWNRCVFGTHMSIGFSWEEVGLPSTARMSVRDLFGKRDLGCMAGNLSAFVDPDDVLLVRLSPGCPSDALVV